MKQAPIHISIVDDHPMIITGLVNMLQDYPHLVIEGTYSNGSELLKGLEHNVPDVLLLDIQLPDKPGDELVTDIFMQYPGIRILALTNFNSMLYVNTMLRRGAAGYLLKTTDQDTLVAAIESVYNGITFIEPLLKSKIEAANPANHSRVYSKLSLTIREKEILRLLVAGQENHKIAEQLHLGYNTVRNYRARIFDKLEVNSISELISKALTQGLVE